MYSRVFFLLILAAISPLFSCHDLDPADTTPPKTCEDTIHIYAPGNMEHGYLKAVNTCLDWQASGYARVTPAPSNNFLISGTTFYPFTSSGGVVNLAVKESLSMRLPNATGKYPVKDVSWGTPVTDFAIVTINSWDYDVMSVNWKIDDSFSDNEVEITEIDLVNKRVRGRFNLHFVRTYSTHPELEPARFFLFDGEFNIEILE